MPRRLILMRHAKSAWDEPELPDHERPLNARGRRDAPRVGRRLVELGWIPDLVVSSDAVRTRQTWERVQTAMPPDITTRYERALYGGDLVAMRALAPRWDERLGTVLLLGHNPGWQRTLAGLSGRDLTLTTANAALLEGTGDTWEQALWRRWTLVDLIRPRELRPT